MRRLGADLSLRAPSRSRGRPTMESKLAIGSVKFEPKRSLNYHTALQTPHDRGDGLPALPGAAGLNEVLFAGADVESRYQVSSKPLKPAHCLCRWLVSARLAKHWLIEATDHINSQWPGLSDVCENSCIPDPNPPGAIV